MKLKAEIGDEKIDVEFTRDGDTVTATIGDRNYVVEASEVTSGVYLFKHEGRVFEAAVTPSSIAGTHSVRLRGNSYDVRLFDPKKLRGTDSNHANADGLVVIKTAMPGKVVRIVKNTGDAVSKGDSVVVVEAMKMQNELKSQKDGVVKELKVTEGQTVSAGDVLAIIE
jgi:acetyl/propionyl-CoA carboxylase alpha subunit